MNQKKINQSIESLILNAPENYVFNQNDLHLMRRYDKCEDSELNEQFVFGRVWKMLQKDDDYNELTKEFEGKVLVTHGGSGKAITIAPHGASFHVFNDDYFCHVITRALTSGRKTENFMQYDFGSVAEFFYLNNTDFLPQFDLVISQPPAQCHFARLDGDESLARLAKKDSRAYYAVRGMDFLETGGVLSLILPRRARMTTQRLAEDALSRRGVDFVVEESDRDDQFILNFIKL